jgi:membrane peptidoglycan carboxypeptidase
MKFFARLRSRKKKGGSRLFRYGWKVTLLVLLAGAGFAVFLFYGTWAQTFDMKNVGVMPERNTVYDVNGKIYSRLAGANRLKVSLSEVSPYFIAAVLAREDTRFYDHKGIDWRGIMRALVRDIMSGSAKEGASSITQQLARNSLPLGGRTLSRKLLEAMVALRIERQFSKQQILELYVNRIYFGNGCYGVETASQAYFGKSASKLNLPGGGAPGRIDPQPQSIFTVKESGGRKDPTQRRTGPYGSIEKTFAGGCRSRQAGEGRSARQAYAFCSGELRDGRCAARSKFVANTGSDR